MSRVRRRAVIGRAIRDGFVAIVQPHKAPQGGGQERAFHPE